MIEACIDTIEGKRSGPARERPILFSAPMIRALLDGRKTQTRRAVKNRDPLHLLDVHGFKPADVAHPQNGYCPYGYPGDRLWVREAWTKVPASAYRMSEGVQQTDNPADPDEAAIYAVGWDRSIPKWKPSIHMPRWACRLVLEVTEVRVERLQDISRTDAAAEGLHRLPATGRYVINKGEQYFGGASHDPREVYARLWDHINGPGAWDINPWVWAITFKRIDAQ